MAQPVPYHLNQQDRKRQQQDFRPNVGPANPPWNPNSARAPVGNQYPNIGTFPRPQQQATQYQNYAPSHQYPMPNQQQPAQYGAFHPPENAHASSYGVSTIPKSNINAPHQDQDFFQQISQNPMAGIAMHTASDFIQKQSQMYFPGKRTQNMQENVVVIARGTGAFGVWGSVKYYFTVNNSYVKNRCKILIFPFWHKSWRRHTYSGENDQKKIEYAPPIRDINAPDLYIPLMGFLTYILIVGYTKGASNQFSPDVIGADASYCLIMQLMEVGVLALCLYLLQSSLSFLDLVSFSGYKYVSLVINAIFYQFLGSAAYYAALVYTGIAVSYFTLNCMKGSVPEPTPDKRSFRNYMLFSVSCLQLVLVCFISYTTAPH